MEPNFKLANFRGLREALGDLPLPHANQAEDTAMNLNANLKRKLKSKDDIIQNTSVFHFPV